MFVFSGFVFPKGLVQLNQNKPKKRSFLKKNFTCVATRPIFPTKWLVGLTIDSGVKLYQLMAKSQKTPPHSHVWRLKWICVTVAFHVTHSSLVWWAPVGATRKYCWHKCEAGNDCFQPEGAWIMHKSPCANMWKLVTAKKQPHTFLSQIGLNGHVCFTCQSLWKLVTLHLDLCRVHDCALCQKFFSLLLGILSVFTQCSTQTFASLHCVLNWGFCQSFHKFSREKA